MRCVTLYCSDLRAIRPFGCCNSCHEDDEMGYGELSDTVPDDVAGKRAFSWLESRIRLVHCCAAPTDNLTRDEWARMVRSSRRR